MSLRPAAILRTHRRFKVSAVPDDFRERYIAALNENGFREPLSEVSKEIRVGWCDAVQPLVTTFDDTNRWLYNQYAVFAMRVEQKKLPGRRFRAELQRRVEAWCQANNRERCPSKVKTELKESLEMEMLQKTLPKMDAPGVIWHLAEGWLVIGCTSETRLDTFRKLFHRTFGIALVPTDPFDMAGEELGCKLLDIGSMDFRPAPGVIAPDAPTAPPVDEAPPDEDAEDEGAAIREEEDVCPPHVATEFMLWLWWRSAEGRGRIPLGDAGELEFWLDGKIDFRVVGETRTATSVALDAPEHSINALAALASGQVVKGLGLALRREDREYALRLTGPLLHRSSLKLPALVKSGEEGEMLYEAAFLYEEAEHCLTHLFRAFARQRTADGWEKQGAMALRRWLGLEIGTQLSPLFGVDEETGQVMLFARRAA